MANKPKRLSDVARNVLAAHESLTDDDLMGIIRATPGWRGAVKPVEEVVYPSDPVEFMRDTLGYTMWSKLEEICYSVRDNHNTVVSSGFGVGKSISAAALACWWLCTRTPAAVITIAPTWSQVQSILWRYIRQVGRKAHLPGVILETPRWEVGEDKYAYGLSPRKSTDQDMASMQGRHNPNLLLIADEGAGLARLVWQTMPGLVVSESNRLLVLGNPIEQSGPFWDACNSPNWNMIQISCMEHPNIIEGREVIPGAVSRNWIKERVYEWCQPAEPDAPNAFEWEGDWYTPLPIFQAKVFGQAPEQGDDQLIRLSWIEAAKRREQEPSRGASVVIGFDPARHGSDSSAMCTKVGSVATRIQRRKGLDTQQGAAWLTHEAAELDATHVFIDSIGLGSGVADRSRALGTPIVEVNFSQPAAQRKRFLNLRAEAYWALREALRNGELSLPEDTLLEGDLVAPRYTFDPLGRIVIESKDEIRARIGRSPDSSDALALTFAYPYQGNLELGDDERRALLTERGGEPISRWSVTKASTGRKWRIK